MQIYKSIMYFSRKSEIVQNIKKIKYDNLQYDDVF